MDLVDMIGLISICDISQKVAVSSGENKLPRDWSE